MQLKLIVLEPENFTKEAQEILSRIANIDYAEKKLSQQDLKKVLREYDIVLTRLQYKFDAALLKDLSDHKCRIIAVPATGVDHIDLDACQLVGIKVISLKNEREFLKNVRATAEHTIGLTLSLLRNTHQAAADVLDGNWNRDVFRGYELHNRKIGIIGLGRLGAIVAKYFLAFDCEVLGYDIRPVDIPCVKMMPGIKELVKEASIISLHMDYNTANHHLFNDEIFAGFNKGAYLINTSRGQIVDDHSLLRALENGTIGKAALDVLEGEPGINASNPLVHYAKNTGNILLTPHIGGCTFESTITTEVFIAEKITKEINNWK